MKNFAITFVLNYNKMIRPSLRSITTKFAPNFETENYLNKYLKTNKNLKINENYRKN